MRKELQDINQIACDLMAKPESKKMGMLIWLLVGAIDIALGYCHYPTPDEYLAEMHHHIRGVLRD